MLWRANCVRILAGSRLLMVHNGGPSPTSHCSCPRSHPPALFKMSCLPISGLSHSPTKGKGQIQVILGPMFSGKSTELIRRIKRYQIANHNCLLIKYSKDSRYSDDYMATHDKQMLSAVNTELLRKVNVRSECSVIGIDEGQFFPDIVEFCEEMANDGIRVIVAALDGTFQRKAFGSILSLIPLAESVVKLNAVCMICYGEAAFTKRIGSETEVEVIGGTDKYMAVCRQCFRSKSTRAVLGEVSINCEGTTPAIASGKPVQNTSVTRQLKFRT